MPNWNRDYYSALVKQFTDITKDLSDALESVIQGRVSPAIDDLTIGSGRKLRAAVLFFDIRHFTSRASSAELTALKECLLTLDSLLPMMMQIVFDHGGYVEKNTGDGMMAILGAEKTDQDAANDALDAATTMFYVMQNVVNPLLGQLGLPRIDARIGIDLGTLLIARIGRPTGTAKQSRNFLTAIGPSANLASHLQESAGTNEIWVGDLIKVNAAQYMQNLFVNVTPNNWTWHYKDDPYKIYHVWNFNAVKRDPG